MADEYRLGFNYDGIIKLAYRVIVGFFAFKFGYFIHNSFPKWAEWILSIDGVNASKIKDIHLTLISTGMVILGTIITYRVLLNIVKKYIVTRKLKKVKKPGYVEPSNSIDDGHGKRY